MCKLSRKSKRKRRGDGKEKCRRKKSDHQRVRCSSSHNNNRNIITIDIVVAAKRVRGVSAFRAKRAERGALKAQHRLPMKRAAEFGSVLVGRSSKAELFDVAERSVTTASEIVHYT